MMARRLREKTRAMQNRTALGILGRKHQPFDARQTDRARTHRARLERDIERRSEKTFVAKFRCSRAQRQQLGMCGRVMPLHDAVALGSEQRAFPRQKHRTDRHFAPARGVLGFGKRQCYGFNVVHRGPEEFGQD